MSSFLVEKAIIINLSIIVLAKWSLAVIDLTVFCCFMIVHNSREDKLHCTSVFITQIIIQ